MFKSLRRIQWKLTVSYAIVTAGTVLALAAILVGIALIAESQNSSRTFDSFFWSKTGFQDNVPFLLEDAESLHSWLDRIRQNGFFSRDITSYPLRESLDYANTLVRNEPIFVLDTDLNILAASPLEDPGIIGEPYAAHAPEDYRLTAIIDETLTGSKNYYSQSILFPDGRYLVAFPLRRSDADPVSAIVVYQVKPLTFATPANLEIYRTFFIVTVIGMLIVSLPVGAVFGWLASRGLRRRLEKLSAASGAWSSGLFSAGPVDRSGDEIGELTRNLNTMAEQIKTLIQTRDELTRIEERNRLARDLHDTVKQQTYAARMQLTAAKNLMSSDPNRATEHVNTALQLNRETQQELTLIIDQLRPAALDGKGLPQALEAYAERWQEHTGVSAATSVSGSRPLPLEVEQALYRILQEALANVARHAEAESVAIALDITPDTVKLTVSDDGRGFEPDAVSGSSLGMAGMKQRMAGINGSLAVESVLSAGTKITAEVQLIPGSSPEVNHAD